MLSRSDSGVSPTDSLDSDVSHISFHETPLPPEEPREEEEPVDPRTLLTSEQVQFFKQIFVSLTPQDRGLVPTKVLGTVIRGLGYNPTKAEIKKYVAMADPESKGAMDFHGFLLPLAEISGETPETFEEILTAFKALDEHSLGYIPTKELNECLTTLGEYLEDFEIETFISAADPKGEGKVMYEEFLEKQFNIVKKKNESTKEKKTRKKKK